MMGRMIQPWGDWKSMPDYMQNMMRDYYSTTKPFWGVLGILDLITWVLVITLLFAAVRYLWKKGGQIK